MEQPPGVQRSAQAEQAPPPMHLDTKAKRKVRKVVSLTLCCFTTLSCELKFRMSNQINSLFVSVKVEKSRFNRKQEGLNPTEC